jgi:hypothetical protein
MKDDLTAYGSHPIEQLSNAIVVTAVEDLTNALVQKHDAEQKLLAAESMITDCKTFFASDWYKALTNIEAEKLLDIAQKQAEYLIWKRKRGCKSCKESGCLHSGKKNNWYEWSIGEKKCQKRKKQLERESENEE